MEMLEVVLAVLCIATIVTIVRGPIQAAIVAFTRQMMFEERDAVFDLARSGRIEFDSPAYRETRQSIEALIRQAHRSHWYSWLFVRIVSLKMPHDAPTPLHTALDQVADPVVRDQLRHHLNRAFTLALGLAVARSPLLLVALLVTLPFASLLKRPVKREVAKHREEMIDVVRRADENAYA